MPDVRMGIVLSLEMKSLRIYRLTTVFNPTELTPERLLYSRGDWKEE